jgi:hypothetical protein
MESTVSPRVDAAEVIVGLDEYVVLDAVDDGDLLTITVTAKRLEAPCPECGVFSARVKSARTQTVVDADPDVALSVQVASVCRSWVSRQVVATSAGVR